MNILVINAGSSSLKYQLIDMNTSKILAKGLCERIGIDGAISHTTCDDKEYKSKIKLKSHKEAFNCIANLLTNPKFGVIANLDEIGAVGHRIVQGAEKFDHPTFVTEDVLVEIEKLGALAPLHNPAHVQAIRACIEAFNNSIKQVVVFDTSFHQTIPEKAYLYSIPYDLYKKYHVRKYGFHGTSHKYVSARAAKLNNTPIEKLKIVSCHLGNGSSISAVAGGKSVDTTMGFTPIDGVIMGTRCGNIDASCVTFLMKKLNLDPDQMSEFLNKKSGLLGLSGVSSDCRDVKNAADSGNKLAQISLDILSYQVRKKIAASAAAMNGIDILIFTGGIGENSDFLRKDICSGLTFLGIKIDPDLNKKMVHSKEGFINSEDSRIAICIIPTNEELMIAKETLNLIRK